MQKWQYMTWRVSDLGQREATVRTVNGEDFDSKERPPLYEALVRAGEDGWDLVGMDGAALIFKRPLLDA